MIKLTPGKLTLPQLRQIARERVRLELDPASHAAIDASAKAVEDIAAKGLPAYGINTGFGRLANTHIPADQLELLQRNLLIQLIPLIPLMDLLEILFMGRLSERRMIGKENRETHSPHGHNSNNLLMEVGDLEPELAIVEEDINNAQA